MDDVTMAALVIKGVKDVAEIVTSSPRDLRIGNFSLTGLTSLCGHMHANFSTNTPVTSLCTRTHRYGDSVQMSRMTPIGCVIWRTDAVHLISPTVTSLNLCH